MTITACSKLYSEYFSFYLRLILKALYLSKEELKIKFPNGYKELPNEIYKRICVIPATFIVDEHHVHVYAYTIPFVFIAISKVSTDLLAF